MLNVIVYARVSSLEQDYSGQLEQIKQFCALNDYNILSVYTDKSTGSNTDRPGYKDMITALEKSGGITINALVITKLDRLGRSIRDLLFFIDNLQKHNVQFVSINDNVNTTTPQGRLFLYLLSALAEFEREMIRERTEAGRKRYISAGGRMGPPIKPVPMDEVLQLLQSGVPKTRIAKKYKISVPTLYNKIREHQKK
jgi:DNA invertase Pin-like site-specific DNA recombinase